MKGLPGNREILELVKQGRISAEEGVNLYRLNSNAMPSSENEKRTGECNYFVEQWMPTVPETLQVSAQGNSGVVILFTEDDMLRTSFLNREYDRVIIVKRGEYFFQVEENVFRVSLGQREDLTKLFHHLDDKGIRPEYHIFDWGRDSFQPDELKIEEQLMQGFYSMFIWTQLCISSNWESESKFLYLVHSDGEKINPLYASMTGFAKTACKEHPKLHYRIVQLEHQGSTSQMDELIHRELIRPWENEAEEIKYIHNDRFERRLEQSHMHSAKSLPFKKGGTYLVTGGAGGIGRRIASYLSEQWQTNLLLVGRSLPSKVIQDTLEDLCSRGGEAVYYTVDISNSIQVRDFMNNIKEQGIILNGVIHCAGVTEDSFILNKDVVDARRVLAPKIQGTIWLDEWTKSEPLDFFVLFSSIASVFGNVGQSDYAFANRFLDLYAEQRMKKAHPGISLSINWPFWLEGGMKISDEVLKAMETKFGMVPLTTGQAITAFEHALQSGDYQQTILAGDPRKIQQSLIEPAKKNLRSHEVQHAVEDGLDNETLLRQMETFLKDILSKEIKLAPEKISSSEVLETYGIDSIRIMNLNYEMEKHFDSLSKTIFFEYQNVSDIAKHCLEQHRSQLIKKFQKKVDVKAASRPSAERPIQPFRTNDIPARYQMEQLKKTQRMDKADVNNDIAIIGLSGRYPMAENVQLFWNNIKMGKDCITEIPSERWDAHAEFDPSRTENGKSYSKWGGFIDDADKFDSLFFNISPREASMIDPQERLFLETAWHTIEDAGYAKNTLSGRKVGVYVGVMYGLYQFIGVEESLKGNRIALNSSFSSVANRVSYYFNWRGPSMAVDTMCSSSLTAVHLACESIRRGECEMALAGGVNLSLHPNKYLLLSQGNYVSSDGRCRSFGDGGDGYVPGEGVGAVLLKSLSQAVLDGDHIYAVVKGSAVNHGGKTNGYTVPNPLAQCDVVTQALQESGIDPRTISYLEAHGTGTALGDPIEVTGLTRSFRQFTDENQFCALGSVKSNIGHLESAAGMAGITKIIFQMKSKELAPTLHSLKPNENISLNQSPFYLQHKLTEWKRPRTVNNGIEVEHPRRAGISSFGAGGSNAHLVLEEYEESSLRASTQGAALIIILSAKREEQLKEYAQRLKVYLEQILETNSAASKLTDLSSRKDHSELAMTDCIQVIADHLQISPNDIDLNERFQDVGLNWADLNSISQRLNDEIGNYVPVHVLSEHPTIGSFVREFAAAAVCNSVPNDGEPSLGTDQQHSSSKLPISIEDLAYTLQMGRESMDFRLAMVASTLPVLLEKLVSYCSGERVEGLYVGNLHTERVLSEMISEGKEGEEFIKIMVREKKANKLAQLWVSGLNMNWAILYENVDPYAVPKKIPLPGYPFEKVRHWVSRTNEQKGIFTSRKSLHPYLDRINFKLSISDGVVFEKTWESMTPLFKDHNVNGNYVFPGVGCIELVSAALQQVDPGNSYSIVGICWIEAFKWEGRSATIRIRLKAGKLGGYKFSIFSGDGASSVVYAEGRLESTSQQGHHNYYTIKDILSRCPNEFRKETIYGYFQRTGVEYGETFQGLKHLWANETEAIGLIQLPVTGFEDLTYHPTLMDAAMQTIVGMHMKPGLQDETARMPFSIEQVDYYSKVDHRAYAYTKRIGDSRFDIFILDEDGKLCIRMHDVALRSVGGLKRQSVSDMQYVAPVWRVTPPSSAYKVFEPDSSGSVIVMYSGNEWGVGQTIHDFYGEARTVYVKLGSSNIRHSAKNWEIDVYNPVLLGECIAEVDRLTSIFFLNGTSREEIFTEWDALELTQAAGVFSLFRLVRELQEAGYVNKKLQFKIVTWDSQQVMDSERLDPYASSMFGFVKSLAKECSDWIVNCVDVPAAEMRGKNRELMIDHILREYDLQQVEIAYRSEFRYTRSLIPVELPTHDRFNFRSSGCYLLIGGAGGIGLELSRYLAQTVQAKLVWIGRRAMNPELQTKVLEIESCGGQVLYIQSDATDLDMMKEAIGQAKSTFGSIHGVIHSAIVLKDRIIENMDESMLRDVLAPKVKGTVALYQIMRDEPLDFVLFFSSLQSFTCNAGQSNYAAGCTFKDAFASYWSGQVPYPVKTINWGYWGSVGVVSSNVHRERLGKHGIYSIEPKEGIDAVRLVLANELQQVSSVKASKSWLEKIGVDFESNHMAHPKANPPFLVRLFDEYSQPFFDEEKKMRFTQGLHKVHKLGAKLLLKQFIENSVFAESMSYYPIEKIKKNLKILPKYERLLISLLSILEQEGYISKARVNYKGTPLIQQTDMSVDGLQAEQEAIIRDFPEFDAYIALLLECSRHYTRIWNGEVPATDIMFPSSSMKMVEGIYQKNSVADYYNELIAWTLKHYIEMTLPNLKSGEKINIIEVGAGTGGTSSVVLKRLSGYGESLTYSYTDISNGFIQYGKERYGKENPYVEFRSLDIERPLDEQNLTRGSFNVVIATNVLHATHNIHRTIANINWLLNDNGLLMINEATQLLHFATFTFGLLDGWWMYEDEELRVNGSPLLDKECWKRVLDEQGFSTTRVLYASEHDDNEIGQHVILAERNGKMRSENQQTNRLHTVVSAFNQPQQVIAESVRDITGTLKEVPDTDLKHHIELKLLEGLSIVLGMRSSEIDRDASFSDYGLDSILALKLIKYLNEQFSIEVRTTALFDHASVGRFSLFLQEQYGQQIAVYSERKPLQNQREDISSDKVVEFAEQYLIREVAHALGMNEDKVQRGQSFSDYGLDSILALQLIKRLNESLQLELRTTVLFDYPDIQSVSEYLLQHYKDQFKRMMSQDSLGVDSANSDSTDELEWLERLAKGEIDANEAIRRIGV